MPMELTQLHTPPEAIVKKEQELSELLDRVLNAPLKPVREALDDLTAKAARSNTRLAQLSSDLSSTDEEVGKVKKNVIEILEKLSELEEGLRAAFAATARAHQISEAATASSDRDRELLDALRAARDEAQQTAQTEASRGRYLLMLLAAVLVATCGDIMVNILIHMHG